MLTELHCNTVYIDIDVMIEEEKSNISTNTSTNKRQDVIVIKCGTCISL